ncbi:MAG: deoxyguanosinetriphosphate triphosphohydrolase [Ignavibacteriales bacterium CG12_big_fil_rev_8_21_14_0_65_30_8]|nr:MAG: deoxyguanosinetriphosphate triphosphohydrolase [Ignavibacteriales bacterium CG12_big_fil_rev_8_21_14_0_65_30_8]
MNWENLLSTEIYGQQKKSVSDGRSQFQRDFDRIVFCSAFRRLQDKTQVFPLPESDFVHTRLTHSLEVSCVGRSLGNLVGKILIEKHKELEKKYLSFNFGEIVAASCLAHDIGNPPFGHSGEDAISEYFKNSGGKIFKSKITDPKKWNDLINFEGNAQGFRIIAKLQNPDINGGLRLSLATLGAFTKYPRESKLNGTDEKIIKGNKIYRKHGFFQSEKNIFESVADGIGLIKLNKVKSNSIFSRHPLAYLVEAADDICYGIMDLEDAFRLGILSFSDTEELLLPFVGKNLRLYNQRSNHDKIGYLRAKTISNLVKQLSECFVVNEKKILDGKMYDDLITHIPSNKTLKRIKKISKEKIYSYKSVLEREAAGYEVIGGLLDIFITAVNEGAEGKLSNKNKSIIQLLPKHFFEKDGSINTDLYERLLKVTDYISGMTDSFAISLFRRIKGISLPSS